MPGDDDTVPAPDESLADETHHVSNVVIPLSQRRKPTDAEVAKHPAAGPSDSIDEATLRVVQERLSRAESPDESA